MEKQQQILEGASKVVAEQGLHRLTLDAVAKECGLSKAGLIHHFPNKEGLITAMNEEVAARFTRSIEDAYRQESSYNKAYLDGSLKELNGPDVLNVSTSLLAAAATNRELIQPWNEKYQDMDAKMKQDGVSDELAQIVRLVSDGLWFANMFDLLPLSEEKQKNIKTYIFELIEKEKKS
ncbi:TetR/AcrR family transcriptional regulator [Salibacterium aidingense]|uniref:TetR/AcrR family transcriptional regulator n=1 Tax=Salibacterium aidingense TaxID=384933 RepID=UPI000426A806|nr:TetR/AcrR family transcriptional regulator [Salibacterium aidingense]